MAHGKPWYKRSGGDMLLACMGMPDAEHKWAYSCLIDMLNDRDQPLPDDSAFICGFTGLTKRKWAAVRQYLTTTPAGAPRIIITEDGYLSNPRFHREWKEREIDRERSIKAGREGGKKSAAIRAENQQRPEKVPQELPESSEKHAPRTEDKLGDNLQKRQNSAEKVQPPPQASRAREEARGESIREESTTQRPSLERREGVNDDRPIEDIYDLTIACCDAAGMTARIASRPALLTQSIDIVKGWVAAGIDIRETAIPVIENKLMGMDDAAHSLAKFAAAIDTHHAKAKRHKARIGVDLPKPATAVYEFDDEPQALVPFRQSLAQAIGQRAYAEWCKSVRFEVADRLKQGDGEILNLIHRANGKPLHSPSFVLERHRDAIKQTAAEVLGTTDAWERVEAKASYNQQSGRKP